MLCAVLEHVVSFRMKLQVGWFGAEEKLSFWQFLTAALRKNSQYMARLRAVEAIETLRTELAKERAFLRIALIDKSFAELVAYVSTRRDAIRNFYNDGSFFSESTRANRVLLEAAKRLAMHDFSFDVRQQTLNAPFTIEIDFCALSASPRPSKSYLLYVTCLISNRQRTLKLFYQFQFVLFHLHLSRIFCFIIPLNGFVLIDETLFSEAEFRCKASFFSFLKLLFCF